jgi:hypothetical protein
LDASANYHNYTLDSDADHDEVEVALSNCLLYYSEDLNAFPLAFPDIATQQQANKAVQALLELDRYKHQESYSTPLVDQWRIVMSEAFIEPSINWYHYVLGHVGTARLSQTLQSHFWIRQLQQQVKQVVISCDLCQCNKNPGPCQGHLPPRQYVEAA